MVKKWFKIIFGLLTLGLVIACLILAIYNFATNEIPDQNHCFRAAVYEHIRQGNLSNNKQAIDFNLKVYENVSGIAASHGAKIIVFPEYGLFFTDDREYTRLALEVIPDPKDGNIYNPCNQPEKYSKNSTILYRLSCSAKNNQLYLAADMGDIQKCLKNHSHCPDDGFYFYNTAVLFDDKGNLVAKYHKMQLFGEEDMNIPEKSEFVYADTPFGRVGMFICFDMIFKSPGLNLTHDLNVTTMLFPTWWFDELPFLTAVQYHHGWAVTNQVNLLSSNIHRPILGSIGSGIHSGQNGYAVYTNENDNKPKLLLADIPIDSKSNKHCDANSKMINIDVSAILNTSIPSKSDEYSFLSLSMTGVIQKKLVKASDSINLIDKNLNCNIKYQLLDNKTLKQDYYLIAVNKTRQSIYQWCEEFCALVKCKPNVDGNCESFTNQVDDNLFKSVSLSSSFSTKYVYPNAITNNIKLIPLNQWKFSIDNKDDKYQAQISVDSIDKPLLVLGLYGRCYQRDPPYNKQMPTHLL